MRSILVVLVIAVATPVLGGAAFLLALLGFDDTPGSFLDRAPRWWAKSLLWAAGVEVAVHNPERMSRTEPRVYVANHVSWFDVLAMAAILPHYRFVGKAELFRIPIFGHGMRATGMISIERDNRKSAFESYNVAAERIRSGASVVVYPEGTRGRSYALRPFKKGPFVLAVAAGVPVVPTLLHGTIEILPRGAFWLRPGTVHVHFLESVDTQGMTYDQRDVLMREVWERMAREQLERYGVDSGHASIERPVGTPG